MKRINLQFHHDLFFDKKVILAKWKEFNHIFSLFLYFIISFKIYQSPHKIYVNYLNYLTTK